MAAGAEVFVAEGAWVPQIVLVELGKLQAVGSTAESVPKATFRRYRATVETPKYVPLVITR